MFFLKRMVDVGSCCQRSCTPLEGDAKKKSRPCSVMMSASGTNVLEGDEEMRISMSSSEPACVSRSLEIVER